MDIVVAAVVGHRWSDLDPALPFITSPPRYASQLHPLCLTTLPYPLPYPSIILGLTTPFPLSLSPSYSSLLSCQLFYTRSRLVLADGTRFLIFQCVHGHLSMWIHHTWAMGPDVNARGAG